MMIIFYEKNFNKHSHHSIPRKGETLFGNIRRSTVSKVMIVCLLAFVLGMVSGCSSTSEISIIPNEPSPTLRLQLPEPLVLDKEYEWRLFKDEENGIILGLTEEGYKIHQRNMEAIQGRIFLLMEYLNQYRLFYEADESSPRT